MTTRATRVFIVEAEGIDDIDDLIDEIEGSDADLVVVSLPNDVAEGVGLLEQMKQRKGFPPALVVTAHVTLDHARDMLRAGAAGVLGSSADATTLMSAIREVADGRKNAMWTQGDGLGAEVAGPSDTPPRLSRREREVLALVAAGHTNQEAADHMGVSVKTVEGYRARLMRKLDVRNRVELVQAALRYGLLAVDDGPPPTARGARARSRRDR